MIGSIVNKRSAAGLALANQRPEDIRGKKIGITRLGAASIGVAIMLRNWNMTPNDVRRCNRRVPGDDAARKKANDAAVPPERRSFRDDRVTGPRDLADMDMVLLHREHHAQHIARIESRCALHDRFVEA